MTWLCLLWSPKGKSWDYDIEKSKPMCAYYNYLKVVIESMAQGYYDLENILHSPKNRGCCGWIYNTSISWLENYIIIIQK